MKYFIITGASKGLGEGIAIELIDPGHHIICISRSESKRLKELAEAKNCKVDFILFDLNHTHNIDTLMEKVFRLIDIHHGEGFYLINNAGVITPVGPAEECPSDETEQHIKINLIAPMLITANFIKLTNEVNNTKRIIHISSGAAQHPYHGWSSYCTGKAGIDMHTRCIATEQQNKKHPVGIMSVAPGIIDTQMQETIRNTPGEKFINRDKFVEYKEKGQLVKPSQAGKKIKELLLSNKFKNGEIIDLR